MAIVICVRAPESIALRVAVQGNAPNVEVMALAIGVRAHVNINAHGVAKVLVNADTATGRDLNIS